MAPRGGIGLGPDGKPLFVEKDAPPFRPTLINSPAEQEAAENDLGDLSDLDDLGELLKPESDRGEG